MRSLRTFTANLYRRTPPLVQHFISDSISLSTQTTGKQRPVTLAEYNVTHLNNRDEMGGQPSRNSGSGARVKKSDSGFGSQNHDVPYKNKSRRVGIQKSPTPASRDPINVR